MSYDQNFTDVIDFSLKRLSITDFVSDITDIRYIDNISIDISDIFNPGDEFLGFILFYFFI